MLQATDRAEKPREELSRCGPADLARARAQRDALLRAARSLAAVVRHDPDVADCTTCGCALALHPGPARCALAHRLADVEQGPCPTSSFEVALARFDAAVGDAVDAVRRCRQIEHGVGRCWFAAVAEVDGCRDILRLAHQIA